MQEGENRVISGSALSGASRPWPSRLPGALPSAGERGQRRAGKKSSSAG
ncbi:hypothetical protein MJ524_05885 [Escherichia coli]|nr:hypothetical protein MJ524_05885 [Escherichia coli]